MQHSDEVANYIPVEFYGPVDVTGRSETMMLLVWEQRQRIIPIWVPQAVADVLQARLDGEEPRRPDWPDVVWDVVDAADTSIDEIRIDTFYEGLFTAHLILGNGKKVDVRPSIAMILAVLRNVPILVRQDVMQQASLWVAPEQALEYLNLELPEEGAAGSGEQSASGDNQADADFARFMAELGADENELFPGWEEDSDS